MAGSTRPFAVVRAVIGAAALLLTGCGSTLPALDGRMSTQAFNDTAATRLGRALDADVAAHPGRTGIHPLVNPRDAFAARAVLAAAAERSIDAQYYIWHDDTVGVLLFEALWRAAERGVRVRLLLDDMNTGRLDPMLAALDAHPGIEVRLYNPFVQRSARLVALVTDFGRLNRRMHNKSFTVDNRVTVVGGRNVGDEYFGAGGGMLFADLDVIAVGDAVPAVSRQFDLYWNSASAYPAAMLIPPAAADEGAVRLAAAFDAARGASAAAGYLAAVRATPIVRDVLARRLEFDWSATRVVFDDPAKTLDTEGRTDVLLFPELARMIGPPGQSLDLISPYFVPGDAGTGALVSLARRGVRVRILTNSLAASDVAAVHAGYARRRRDLLKGGVQLFELKPTAIQETRDEKMGYGSSSSSGLHAKTFAVDRARIFVGSFNFDQRSARLNTELGLVIESPALARSLADAFELTVPHVAYEVRLAEDGEALQWIERGPAGEQRHDTEPGAGALRRLGVTLLSILPIEWLL